MGNRGYNARRAGSKRSMGNRAPDPRAGGSQALCTASCMGVSPGAAINQANAEYEAGLAAFREEWGYDRNAPQPEIPAGTIIDGVQYGLPEGETYDGPLPEGEKAN